MAQHPPQEPRNRHTVIESTELTLDDEIEANIRLQELEDLREIHAHTQREVTEHIILHTSGRSFTTPEELYTFMKNEGNSFLHRYGFVLPSRNRRMINEAIVEAAPLINITPFTPEIYETQHDGFIYRLLNLLGFTTPTEHYTAPSDSYIRTQPLDQQIRLKKHKLITTQNAQLITLDEFHDAMETYPLDAETVLDSPTTPLLASWAKEHEQLQLGNLNID
jgi:hypothetical protein